MLTCYLLPSSFHIWVWWHILFDEHTRGNNLPTFLVGLFFLHVLSKFFIQFLMCLYLSSAGDIFHMHTYGFYFPSEKIIGSYGICLCSVMEIQYLMLVHLVGLSWWYRHADLGCLLLYLLGISLFYRVFTKKCVSYPVWGDSFGYGYAMMELDIIPIIWALILLTFVSGIWMWSLALNPMELCAVDSSRHAITALPFLFFRINFITSLSLCD